MANGGVHTSAASSPDPLTKGLFEVRPERYDLLVAFDSLEELRAEEVSVLSADPGAEAKLVPLPGRGRADEMDWQVKDGSGRSLVLLPQAQARKHYEDAFAPAIRHLNEGMEPLPENLRPYLGTVNWKKNLFNPTELKKLCDEPDLQKSTRGFVKNELEKLKDVPDPPVPKKSLVMLLDFLDAQTNGEQMPWVLLENPLGGEAGRNGTLDPPPVADSVLIKYTVAGPTHVPFRTRVQHMLLGCACLDLHLPTHRDCTTHLRVKLPEGAIFGALLDRPDGFDHIHRSRTQAHGFLNAQKARRRVGTRLDSLKEERCSRAEEKKLKGVGERVPIPMAQTEPLRFGAGLFLLGAAFLPLLTGFARIRGWGIQLVDGTGPGGAGWNLPETLSLLGSVALPLAFGIVAYAWSRAWVRPYAVAQLVLAYSIMILWLLPEHHPRFAGVTFLGILAGGVLGTLQILGALSTALFGIGAPRHDKERKAFAPFLRSIGRVMHAVVRPGPVQVSGIKSTWADENALLREDAVRALRSGPGATP